MNITDFHGFEQQALADGFDEAVVREWAPNLVVASHRHSFAAKAIVVRGEMWLDVGEGPRHIPVGGTFELAAQAIHDERYGPEGATYWVARRNEKATA
jgi:hypothetical protein